MCHPGNLRGPLCYRCALLAFCQDEGHGTPEPVEAERHAFDDIALVGEAPGEREEVVGRPFVGKSGLWLSDAMAQIGMSRTHCRITNAVMCRPPDNNLSQVRAWRHKKNREIRNEAGTLLLDPVEACRPLLREALEDIHKIITLGSEAATAVSGSAKAITKYAGSGEVLASGTHVFYAFRPAYCLRVPNITEVAVDHLRKGFAWLSGLHKPLEFTEKIIRTPADLMHARLTLGDTGWISWDIETDGVEWDTRVRCIGFGNEDIAYVAPFRDLTGRPESCLRDQGLGNEVLRFLRANQHRLVGHNSGQFDRRATFNDLGVDIKTKEDTILLHLLQGNALPRNLGFLGAWLTPLLDSWKADHTATEAKSYSELMTYNAKDVVVTAHVHKALRARLAKQGNPDLVEREHRLQEIGLQMQRVGLRVDMEEAQRLHATWTARKDSAFNDFGAMFPGVNPASPQQLSRVFFDKWKLPIVSVSEKTRQPSVDDKCLRTWVATGVLSEEQRDGVLALRAWRRASKVLGTYIAPVLFGSTVNPGTGVSYNHGTSVLRPAYNRLPASGRYSSSNPNAQNWPEDLRSMIIAPPGCSLVGADYSAIEARRLAEVTKDGFLLDIIKGGLDIHNESLEWVYGKDVWSLEGAPADRRGKGVKGSRFMLARARVKNVRYAFQYGAGLRTIRDQVGRVEAEINGKITFPFAAMPLDEVKHIVNALKKMSPGLVNWWKDQEARYAARGYTEESLWGRKRYYDTGAERSDLANHPIQGSSQVIIMEAMFALLGDHSLVSATRRLDSTPTVPLAWDFEAGTGIMTQTHDNLVLSVPSESAVEWAHALELNMNRRTADDLIDYVGDASIGHRWSEV